MRLACLLSLGLVVLGTACATSVQNGATTDTKATEGGDGGTTLPGEADDAPHALGTITLGETRPSSTGDSRPIISAAFVPDAKLANACTRSVGACEITDVPKCTTGSVQGCATGEVCAFDDACRPKCVKACTKACPAGEECVRASSATGAEEMTCRKRDRFDAGAIAFAGTTTAITLFPPYAIEPDGNGAPFMPQTEIRVKATGASSAGFEGFDETFTSTTFLETDPPLRDLRREEVFGSGPVTLSWVPGSDAIVVSASGPGGAAKCKADDASGAFDLPREVLREVLGTTTSGTPSLTLSVERERREVRKGKKTTGSLSGGQTVQPTGWLELVTTSSESHTYASCAANYTICGDACVNTMTDPKNCGGCGRACLTGQYCSSGACY